MIADSHSRPFDLGDMLDANSTYNLINEVLYGENKTGIGVYDTNQQFQEDLAQGKIDEGAVYLICDIKSLYAEGRYMPLSEGITEEELASLLKTINSVSLVGSGNIQLPTKLDVQHKGTSVDLKLQDPGSNDMSVVKIKAATDEEAGVLSSTLYNRIQTVLQGYPELVTRVDDIAEYIAENEEEIIEKFNTISEFIDQLDENILYGIIQQIADEKSRAELAEQGLDTRLSSVEEDLSSAEESISDMEGSVSRMGDDLAAMEGDLSTAEGDIRVMKGQIATIINNPSYPQYTGPYSVIITETEYAELESYEDNTIYFVIPDGSQSWTFGGTFPITLN